MTVELVASHRLTWWNPGLKTERGDRRAMKRTKRWPCTALGMEGRATNRVAYWVTLDNGLLRPAKEQYAGWGREQPTGGRSGWPWISVYWFLLKSSMLVNDLREGATYRRADLVTLDFGLLFPAKKQCAGEWLEGGSYLQEGDWVTLDNGLLNPAYSSMQERTAEIADPGYELVKVDCLVTSLKCQ